MSEVQISRIEGRGMLTLRGDLADGTFASAVSSAVGLALPGQRGVVVEGERQLAWMSPDELMLMLPAGELAEVEAALAKALRRQHHLLADVSDARATFAITGAGAREVLAKGAPVDLAPGIFAPGEIRRTRLGQVAAAFWMTAEAPERFELVVFRSVAGFVEDWLQTAAQPGSLPGLFARG
ncbi:MAG: sarcosine oxidase subunit gamma family protein [Pseudomonadota bacterium]